MFTALLFLIFVLVVGVVVARRTGLKSSPLVTAKALELRGRATGRTDPAALQRLIVVAALDGAIPSVSVRYLPNSYRVGVAPTDFERWGEVTGIISSELADHVARLELTRPQGDELPVRLLGKARVLLYVDETAAPGAPRISASFSQDTVIDLRGSAVARDDDVVPTARLVVIGLDVAGMGYHEVHLAAGRHLVGRGSDADVRVAHNGVSHRHAELEVTHDGMRVRDLGARNGVTLGGRPLTGTRPLRDGDLLELATGAVIRVVAGCAVAA